MDSRKGVRERLTAMFRHPAWPGRGHFSEQNIAKAYEAGLLPAEKLLDGRYYYGHCRNASVALWNAEGQKFTYIRSKFGSRFPEDILTVENDNGFDLFLPVAEVEPFEDERIENGAALKPAPSIWKV